MQQAAKVADERQVTWKRLAWPGKDASADDVFRRIAPDFSVLSCDIFDTALRRTLARPEDVFLAVGARARAKGLIDCAPDAFAVYRIAAERRVRARIEAAGFDEVRIAEIYEDLSNLGIVADAAATARLEFEVECAVCRPIEPIREALATRAASQKNCKTVFTSDSCLPGSWLMELLQRNGYGGKFEVFSSADFRLSKHTGRLFPALIAAIGCSPGEILHIGDNAVSDFTHPRAHGIIAIHRKRPRPRRGDGSALHPVVRLADSRRRAHAAWSGLAAGDLGEKSPAADGRALAAYAAPLVIGFSLFILAEAARRGIDRIYFLARDGHLPLAIIRRLLAKRGESDRFELCYLQVSRKASSDAAGTRMYLEQSGFTRPGKRLVVDVGWRGSTQTVLTSYAGLPESDVIGCYLGLFADALRPSLTPSTAAGYLCSFGHPVSLADRVRESYVVFELIFSAPHGTVVRFDRSPEGSCRPVHANEPPPTGEIRRAAFAAMEAACIEEFEALDELLNGAWPVEIDPPSALFPIDRLLTNPSHAELALVNRVPFIHDAGSEELMPAVNPLPMHEVILSPRRSLRRLANSPWRAGAVRAALPWPLPGMSYQVLQDRAQRILNYGARTLAFFGGGRSR